MSAIGGHIATRSLVITYNYTRLLSVEGRECYFFLLFLVISSVMLT